MIKRPRLTLERTFVASLDDLWEMWTTPEGIESFMGPEGFSVAVSDLDLRPGGELTYTMSATGADQIDYMQKAGMPTRTHHKLTYTEVTPPRRLAYRELVDFVPGVAPYEVETVVDLQATDQGVRMVLEFEAMHDDHWTRMAVLGRESSLVRLESALRRRRP